MTTRTVRNFSLNFLSKCAIAVVLSIGTIVGLANTPSLAQSAEGDGTANTIKVTPLRSDITINPGESKIVKVTVTNPVNQKVSVRVIQNDFVTDDENGTPAIIFDENEYADQNSLKRFMTPIDNVILEANESRTIDVRLTVPANAEAGGYFGLVRFAPTDPDQGGQVNASASVASLMLLTVTGDAPEKLDLTQFEVQQSGRPMTFFMNGKNLQLAARFENKGKVQAGPYGMVSVTKGDKIIYEADFNNKEQRDVVLPSSARRWNVPLEGIQSFGRYTVRATFTYGSKNQSIDATKTFWVIPIAVMVAAGIGLLLGIALIIGAVLFFRKRRASEPSFSSQRRR